jgi:hypothetical protein
MTADSIGRSGMELRLEKEDIANSLFDGTKTMKNAS